VDLLVNIDRIPTKGLLLEGEITFEELRPLLSEQWQTLDGNLSLTIRVDVRGDGVFARGDMRLRPSASCSRCAADVVYDIHETFLAAFAPEGDDKKELQFDDGVIFDAKKPPIWYPLPKETLDLNEAFGEALQFALPSYPRCHEDCEIPEQWRVTEEITTKTDPGTGGSGVDPRFAKLQEIRDAMIAKSSKKQTVSETKNDSKKG
jgi:uncharacterized metal-binding protein YceD (DUF177 family)